MKLLIATKIQINWWQKQVVFSFYGIKACIERKIEMNMCASYIKKRVGEKKF